MVSGENGPNKNICLVLFALYTPLGNALALNIPSLSVTRVVRVLNRGFSSLRSSSS